MKKFGFLALLAAVLLVGCKPGNNEVTVNSIKINETELTLAVGGSQYLRANTDPVGVEITWASSNAAVAKVNQGGNVLAVSEGTAMITATAGDKTATCKVTVAADAAYDQFNIADWGLFGQEIEYIEGTETIIYFEEGDSALCQLGYVKLIAWDGDLQYVSGSGWAGAGLMLYTDIPLYWIIEGPEKGYYVGSSKFRIGAEEGPYCAQAGYYDVDTYGKRVGYLFGSDDSEDAYTEEDNKLFNEKNGGAIITIVDADNDNWNYLNYGITYAWVNRAVLQNKRGTTPSAWAIDMTWCNWTAEDRLMGFLVDEEKSTEEGVVLVEPYDFSTINRVFDENELFAEDEEEEVMQKGDMSRYHKELPIINGKPLDKTTFHMAR